MLSTLSRYALLGAYRFVWTSARPLLFKQSPQVAHDAALRALAAFDTQPEPLHLLRRLTLPDMPTQVGGVTLPVPLILAAGFVKGQGFGTEAAALAAVARGENIVPGWRSMAALVGPVEYGSYTRHPRLGNPGTVMWRDAPTRSTQNRVGLKNPGAEAAAAFFAARPMPDVYGINIAVSPGVTDPDQEREEVLHAVDAFLSRGVRPSWMTLNLSCPNTEDDPTGNQTADKTRDLCGALVDRLGDGVPLWVKVGPDLNDAQYHALMRSFDEVGVRAVVATNTRGAEVPGDSSLRAGVGGGRLHGDALRAVAALADARREQGLPVDIVGVGGVLNPAAYVAFRARDAVAAQYWSALVYRGPLAAAVILADVKGDKYGR